MEGKQYGDGISWERMGLLGEGSFGSVYKGMLKSYTLSCTHLPIVMAVKSAEISVSESIQEEGEILRNVKKCPNIIEYYGDEITTGETGLMAYNLLLEYGSGGTLGDKIKSCRMKRFSELETRKHTLSILKGLFHIHDAGYVHCDLKPDNVIMVSKLVKQSSEYIAKIGDLGLAKRVMERNMGLRSSWRGTPMYLSPEVVMYGVQEAPCDIWALGCVVLEMLTGKPAWDKYDELDVDEIFMKMSVNGERPVIPKKVSKKARSFLLACFVRDPRCRWTASMLLQHPFVQGLVDDDGAHYDEEAEELEMSDGDKLGYNSVSDNWGKALEDHLPLSSKVYPEKVKRMRKVGEVEMDSEFPHAKRSPLIVKLKMNNVREVQKDSEIAHPRRPLIIKLKIR